VAKTEAEIACEVMDCFTVGDWGRLRSLYADNVREEQVAIELFTEGADAIVNDFRDWKKAFPDTRATVNRVHSDGQTVTLEVTVEGTHTGPLNMGAGKELSPTNRSVSVRSCEVYEIADGKIQQVRIYYDMMTFLKQLDAMKE
jgi:steroid delta-isomerase-like uncharacterized protein